MKSQVRKPSVGVCAALLVASVCGSPAHADTAACIGTVTTLGNHANGHNGLLVVVGNSNSIRVCSFTATQFTVTPEDCKHLASVAAVAFATGAQVTFYIDNAPSTACSSVPAWHVSNTRYFAVSQ